MNDQLSIDCGPADSHGKRLVVAQCNGYSHRDRFPVDSAFHRGKFREAVITRFGWGDEAHEAIETAIIQAADTEDARADQEPLSKPRLMTLANISPVETEWFWEHRFPVGAITDLQGDPGLGKSQLTTDIIARKSRGDSMPPHSADDGTFDRGDCLILSAEDDPARTIRPRLDAAGADCNRVHLLRAVSVIDDDEEHAVTLPIDVAAIESVVIEKSIKLIVIDPFEAHIGDGLNTNANADMRRCLTPLARLAERHACTVVLVRHLNKKSGLSAIYRGGGSVAIVAACRAAHAVAIDPDDPSGRIMACIKSNLGPHPKSLTFSIEQHGSSSRVVWTGTSERNASEVLGAGGKQSGASKQDHAKTIIIEILAQGPRGENEVRGACEQAGISERTYREARKALGIAAERVGFGKQGEWMLTLPEGGHDAEF